MVTIQLPFDKLYVCEVCGETSTNQNEILRHEQLPPPQTPDIHIGNRVLLYDNAWAETIETEKWLGIFRKHRVQKRYVGMSEQPKEWKVAGLHYSRRGERKYVTRNVSLHTLMVTLYGSGSIPACTVIWDLTFEEFSLWRKGNRKELEAAGLVEPEPVTIMV